MKNEIDIKELQEQVNEIAKKLPEHNHRYFKRMEYALGIFLKGERRGFVRYQKDNDYVDDFETSKQFLQHHFGNSLVNFELLFELFKLPEYRTIINKQEREKIKKYLEKISELTDYGPRSIKFCDID